jgi:protease-4
MFVMCNKKRVIKMNKNTFSLLSSSWMLDESSKSALMPFLLGMIQGKEIPKDSFNATSFLFSDTLGNLSAQNDATEILQNSVAVVQIHHPIFKYDQQCGPKGTQTIIGQLKVFEANPNIVGVVLDFNSGGGQVSGTREFFDFVKNYSKPIGSFTNDVIGSAAYYMASGGNFITASKYADAIGSIGVMFSSVNLAGALEKQGGILIEEYSDLSPEKNKLSRALKEGKTDVLIKEYLNPAAEQFHADVLSVRNVNEKALKGDVFNPQKALKLGLIDSIGTLQNAIDKVFELSAKNINTNSTKKMSKDFKNIQAALGLEVAFESNNDAGFFLSENDMETINGLLVGAGTIEDAVTAATTPLTAKITDLEATILNATTSKTAIESALKTALTSAEIENADTLTSEEAIAQLSAKVAEYGALDGATTTAAINDADYNNIGKKNIVGGIDISLAMNN